MSKQDETKLLVASLIALSIGLSIAISTDDVNPLSPDPEYVQKMRIMVGFSIALWALSILLIGIAVAIRIQVVSRPIALGVTLGVLPTVLIAFLHLLPLSLVEKDGAISVLEAISSPIFLPVVFIMLETDLFSGIDSSHASPRNMTLSWLAVTAANSAFWGLTLGLVAALFLKIRKILCSNDGTA